MAASTRLRNSGEQIAKDLRAIPHEKLDVARELPSGKMTVEQQCFENEKREATALLFQPCRMHRPEAVKKRQAY